MQKATAADVLALALTATSHMQNRQSSLKRLLNVVRLSLIAVLLFGMKVTFAGSQLVENLADGRVGKFAFKSVDRKTGPLVLTSGKYQFTDVAVGDLILPDGVGPFPAMVIAHGSGGINKRDYDWAEYFRAKGIASLIVDSYLERGIGDTLTDQGQLTYVASTADQLVALKVLATHPKIDAKRIGIIGFSRGASAALGTAFEKWRARLAGDARFAIHLSFYGGCGWMADTWTGAPLYQFIGDSDDLNQPVSVCEAQFKKMQAAGVPTSLYVFKGARHGFDNFTVTKDYYLGRAVAFYKCSYIWNVESLTVTSPADSTIPKPGNEIGNVIKDCISHGPTLGPNYKATSDAKAIIDKILANTLLLKS
ncbi:dienelactone hydrolase family protein [Noviherbaspirillum sp.]|uniref:dienelactone hydrolase family protein n=1 Tax=Noviherbaspirillum sp. TaxID=1926288 RepID=UPI002B46AA47|nr:dienelactone hydrolase family protein [Noviherbaspirillum sp.]HJV81339.1 dienelactone hydrolase family protein [Noviherbaspirillum sp.]